VITADSNVFIYLYDDLAPEKRTTAELVVRALSERRSAVALQVVGEVQNVLRRKFKAPSWKAAQVGYNLLQAFETFAYSRDAVDRALGQLSAGRFSYWDALLLASADEAGCTTLLSEDMRSGDRLGNVEIVNPFAQDGGLSARARELLES
jgi:predicted nucleic acid-binding protein